MTSATPLAPLLTTLLLAGCIGGGGGGDTSATTSVSDTSTSAPSTTTTTTSASESATTGEAETGETSTSGATTEGTSTTAASGGTDETTSTTDETTSTTTTTGVTTMTTATTGDGSPNNSQCANDNECASGSCYVVPLLGGLCGECKVDIDCGDGGCTPAKPLTGIGAVCNNGEAGDGCLSDAVCTDPNNPHCGLALDASPILTISTCGECKSNADCDAPAGNCSPDVDLSEFDGILQCVGDGSLPNNASCDYKQEGGVPLGNAACASGRCGVAVVENIIKIGVCGECFVNQDCGGGTCQDAYFDANSGDLVGAKCS